MMQLIVLTLLSIFSFLLLLLTSPIVNIPKSRKCDSCSCKTSKMRHVRKQDKEESMYTKPEVKVNEVHTCPNLNDYVHKSELRENAVLHKNPYILRVGPKINPQVNRVLGTNLASNTCPECPKCPKSGMYKENMEWVPIVKSECAI